MIRKPIVRSRASHAPLTDAEAASELGITTAQLRLLVSQHFGGTEDAAEFLSANGVSRSDIVMLRFLVANAGNLPATETA